MQFGWQKILDNSFISIAVLMLHNFVINRLLNLLMTIHSVKYKLHDSPMMCQFLQYIMLSCSMTTFFLHIILETAIYIMGRVLSFNILKVKAC